MLPHEKAYVVALFARADPQGHIEASRIITRHLERQLEQAALTRDILGLDVAIESVRRTLEEVREMWAQMPQPLPIEKVDKPSKDA